MLQTKSPSLLDDAARAEGIEVKRQEALLKTGALQNAVLTSENFSIIATDEKGIIQLFNVGAERMLGYTAAEVVNKINPSDIHDPQEVTARAQALSLELETTITPGFEALAFKASRGIEDIYELTYICKDGSRFPATVSITALRDDLGTIIGYLLIGTDNTKRKRAEEEQNRLEQRLRDQQFYTRSLIESSVDALMTTDPKGYITDANRQMEALTGRTRDELIGAPFKQYFTDPDRAQAGIDKVLRETRVTNYELVVLSSNGVQTLVSYSASTFYDRDRQLQGVFAAARDITAQKQASQYARSLIEASLDPLVTISLDGKITDVNEATVKATGVPREQLVNSDFSNYFTEPDKASEGYQRVFADGFVADYPLTIQQARGKLIDVLYNASVYKDVDGKVLGVFAAARDITDRKLIDQILQEKNIELQSAIAFADKANRAKSDFLSSMSHELRTPLSAILGFAQLIESGTPEPTPSQKRSIDQILQSGWYLLDLINEILDLALIESGRLSLSLEPVSLTEVMQECETMIETQANGRGISLSFPVLSAPQFVVADRRRLKQVLTNLLSNAVKYNSPRGTVAVTSKILSPHQIRICVEDTGAGLSAEKIEQLFQPFNRLGQEAASEQGTGIGLVMTKRLVELMGGHIGVDSQVGKGSTFWVELSLTTAQKLYVGNVDVTPGDVPVLDAACHAAVLLYVEDNPANLMLVKDLIARRPDIRLLWAKDGISGIEIARTALPDVILMDINLPGMSGIEAMRVLSKDAATARIPVVALSANAMPSDIEKGLESGFFRYLTKPIKINEFMKTLDTAFEFSKHQSATAALTTSTDQENA